MKNCLILYLIFLIFKSISIHSKYAHFFELNYENYYNFDCNNSTIGIVANPNPAEGDIYPQAKIDQNYVNWLEQNGAIVVPIIPFISDAELNYTLSKVNGVLFQGGGRYIKPFGQFENFNLKILNYIIEKNKTQNNKIACWVTCQGFELTALLLSGAQFRDNVNLFGRSKGTEDIALKTIEYINANQSDLTDYSWKLKNFLVTLNENYFKSFTSNRTNAQFHTTYVKISSFDYYPALKEILEITSIQYDMLGVPYIDSFQGKFDLNLYGTQFHPEKALNAKVYKSLYEDGYEDAVQVSLGISDFFVNKAAKLSSYCYFNDVSPLNTVRSNLNFNSCGVVDYFYYFNNTDKNYTNSYGQVPIC